MFLTKPYREPQPNGESSTLTLHKTKVVTKFMTSFYPHPVNLEGTELISFSLFGLSGDGEILNMIIAS